MNSLQVSTYSTTHQKTHSVKLVLLMKKPALVQKPALGFSIFFILALIVSFFSPYSFAQYTLPKICDQPEPPNGSNPTYTPPTWNELEGKTESEYQPSRAIVNASGVSAVVNKPVLPFARSMANYLEGKFQTDSHRKTDISRLNNNELNNFNGPLIKILPKNNIDKLRQTYVETIFQLSKSGTTKLEEAATEYGDYCGQHYRTIKDLYDAWGKPLPPGLQGGVSAKVWSQTWGRYWSKFPLVTNWTSRGCISSTSDSNDTSETCVPGRDLLIGVPSVARLAALSQILQQITLQQDAIKESIEFNPEPAKPEGREGPGEEYIILYNASGTATDSVQYTKNGSLLSSRIPYVDSIWKSISRKKSGSLRLFGPGDFWNKNNQGEFSDTASTRLKGFGQSNQVWAGYLGSVQTAKEIILRTITPKDIEVRKE